MTFRRTKPRNPGRLFPGVAAVLFLSLLPGCREKEPQTVTPSPPPPELPARQAEPEPAPPEDLLVEEPEIPADELPPPPVVAIEPAEEPPEVLPEPAPPVPEPVPAEEIPDLVLLIPYHKEAFHAVPPAIAGEDTGPAVAGLPVPLSPLVFPLGDGKEKEAPVEPELPETELALVPDRKEDLIPVPKEGIEPPEKMPAPPDAAEPAEPEPEPEPVEEPPVVAEGPEEPPVVAVVPAEPPAVVIVPAEPEPAPEPEPEIVEAPEDPGIIPPEEPDEFDFDLEGPEPDAPMAVIIEEPDELLPLEALPEEDLIFMAPEILPEEDAPVEPEVPVVEPEPEPEVTAVIPVEEPPVEEVPEVPEEVPPEEPAEEPPVVAEVPEDVEPAVEEAPPEEPPVTEEPPVVAEVLEEPVPVEEPEPPAEPAGPDLSLPGPDLVITSPADRSFYQASLYLEGQCIASGTDEEDSHRIKSLSWRLEALGDWDNPVFMEEDGSFAFDIYTAGLEGWQTLELRAEDFAGRTTVRKIIINDGNQPPRFALKYPGEERLYGSMLVVYGQLRDLYKGIEDLEGITGLSWRIIPQDRSSGDSVVSGTAELRENEVFLFHVDMEGRSGEQVLRLEAEGRNGAVGTLEIPLMPGGSDIPTFAMKPQDGRLVLTWEPVAGAKEQILYLTDDGTVPSRDNPGTRFSGVKSPLVIRGVENGLRYRARLEAVSDEISFWSDIADAVPLAPGTLELTAQGRFEQILLTWRTIPGAASFKVWRRYENETEFALIAGDVRATEYVDADVDFGRTYYYRIEPSEVTGPLSYDVPAAAVEAPSEKITMSSHYRDMTPLKLTVAGEYAYVAAGETGFYIMDVSVPQKPEQVGFLDQSGVKDVYVGEEYAYLASGSAGFQILNIDEPTNPFVILSRPTSDACGIAGRDDIVYVADGGRGLQIFDVSNRQNPRRMGTLRGFPALQLALKGDFLYIATGEGGLKVVDVSSPSSPKVVREYGSTPVYDVLVRNGRFYLACGSQGMVILDDDGTGLREVSRFRSEDARMVRIWEDYAMIADGRGGLKAVDVSMPERPQLFGSFPAGNAGAVAMAEDYALVADVSGLKVVRTYLYGQSFLETSVPTPGRAYTVMLEDSRLWVADRRGGVAVYDASRPASLSERSLIAHYPSEYAEDLLLKDSYLYVADGPAGLKVYDRESGGDQPILTVPVSGRARRVLPYGSWIVVITTGDGLLFLKEQREGEYALSMSSRIYYSDIRDAAFYGSYLFAGDNREGLIVMDTAGGSRPVELEIFSEYEGIRQLMIRNDTLFVLHKKGVSLLDIRNPERPVERGRIDCPDAEGMQMAGNMLYLAEGYRGVSMYRIAEDLSPLKVSDCEEIFAVDVAPAGAYAFFADMEGIGVIRVLIPEWLEE